MLVKVGNTVIKTCELVEHPGGHDGGEFPQYHSYGVAADGSAYYSTGYPESPTDTFCDDEEDDYVDYTTHEAATAGLLAELKKFYPDAEQHPVYQAFRDANGFVVYFEDEVYNS